jgi:putative ABC transport system substrate-binding protein
MTRRKLLTILAVGAVCWLPAAAAQQSERTRAIGMLFGVAKDDPVNKASIAAFQQGLQNLGWTDGHNIRIHYRWASDAEETLTAARELVALRPDVLVTSNTPSTAALLRETSTIPIVFVTVADPVGDRIVASLARPGGNATGFTNNSSTLGGKWLEFLKGMAPSVERIGVLFNPETAPGRGSYFLAPVEAASTHVMIKPHPVPVRNSADIEIAIAALGREQGGGLIVTPDSFTTVHRKQIVALAAQHRVPAIYPFRYFATDGGLMSYGIDLLDLYRRSTSYINKILLGVRPVDLPVQAPGNVEFVLNAKVAGALGLTVPRILRARADKVIE